MRVGVSSVASGRSGVDILVPRFSLSVIAIMIRRRDMATNFD
jgi:hypothetical protein